MTTVTPLHAPAPATFKTFWDAAPMKKDKALAIRNFDRATQPGGYTFKNRDDAGETWELWMNPTPAQLVSAMRKFADEHLQTDPKTGKRRLVTDPSKVLYPCRFISKGRWMDYE